jgi:hypothetical protein
MKGALLFFTLIIFFNNVTYTQSTGIYTFPSSQTSGSSIYPFAYNGTDITNLNEGSVSISGVTFSNSTSNARALNWPIGATTGSNVFTGSIDLAKYFELTLTAEQGYYIHNPGLVFGLGRSGTGPRQFQWRSSIDNFTSAIPIGNVNAALSHSAGIITTPDENSSYTGNSFTINQTGLNSITFRLYAYNAESTSGTGGMQGTLTFNLTVNTSLPVTFNNFSALKSGKINKILWSTASEQNNSGFNIERSTNSTDFENIGFVKSLSSNGNSSSRLDYSFTDFNPIGLNQYYRLKQTDFDGTHKYSAIVMVRREAPTALTLTKVYPNPANSSIYINASVPTKMDLQFLIIDVAGRVVSTKNAFADVGNNGFDMTVEHLESGTYFIKAISKEQGVVATEKFIKF